LNSNPRLPCAVNIGYHDGRKFRDCHNPNEQPFFTPSEAGETPLFNGASAFLWFKAVCKFQNLRHYVCPGEGATLRELFSRRQLDLSGEATGRFVICEEMVALFDFYLSCVLDPGVQTGGPTSTITTSGSRCTGPSTAKGGGGAGGRSCLPASSCGSLCSGRGPGRGPRLTGSNSRAHGPGLLSTSTCDLPESPLCGPCVIGAVIRWHDMPGPPC
jgi:hypothetical protein